MTKTYDALIIGSGFGGIGMAIQLKKTGRHDFLVLEKAGSVGGTWRDNTYPGAACDVESHLYSLSFAPKRDWSRRYGSQAEIQRYIESCVSQFNLQPHLRCNAEVTEMRFHDSAKLWHVTLASGDVLLSRTVITAVGQLNQPLYPNIDGLADFQGPVFHSARWDHSVELTGKTVGVIGTGASAIQFVPQLSKIAKRLQVFQRSGSWVIGKNDRPFHRWEHWCFQNIPGVARLYRTFLYLKTESRAVVFTRFNWLLKYGEWQAHRLARRDMSNEQKRQQLIPNYKIGCNRILLANDWYSSIDLPHVDLVTSPIKGVTARGVVTADGVEHPSDVLVLGTGFRATEFLTPIRVIGRQGIDLNQAWAQGAEAYKGISVSGFPNLFMLYGPNTNLSHSSILLMLESQMHYVLQCLRALERHRAVTMDVKPERQQHYVTKLQKKLDNTVWSSGCSSWYLDDNGRNVVNWFGFTFSYRWMTRRVKVDDYDWVREPS
ncbi:MAG: NAD(P)/FAD-dependent oxidoreductase [Aliidiomarina sp.]|uniref:flavin-containing monooxygenase n=1 Tax=Aliidiomarina sp. TaxID=1872439 RepID=UPI0025C4A19F|nr:NAD(P)/FAD-dependent oxidoreductase [Aliidiomarina sp.]MCH8500749.1 NAD(P)/FAD-dependent oxidoreductase [Aliidiomarina sp.]